MSSEDKSTAEEGRWLLCWLAIAAASAADADDSEAKREEEIFRNEEEDLEVKRALFRRSPISSLILSVSVRRTFCIY